MIYELTLRRFFTRLCRIFCPAFIIGLSSLTVAIDSDSYGIDDSSDLDDDNDGYSDAEEIADGTDPLDVNSSPMGGLSLTLIKAFLDKKKAEQ